MTLPNKSGYVVPDRAKQAQQSQQYVQQAAPPQAAVQQAPQQTSFCYHQQPQQPTSTPQHVHPMQIQQPLQLPNLNGAHCSSGYPLSVGESELIPAHNLHQSIGVPPLGLHLGGLGVNGDLALAELNLNKLLSLSACNLNNPMAMSIDSMTPAEPPVDELQAKKNYLKSHRLLPLIFNSLNECKREGVFGPMQVPSSFLQQDSNSADLSLDDFLASCGLDSGSSPSSPGSPTLSCSNGPTVAETLEFNNKIEALRRQYEDELDKLNKVCNDFCARMMHVLREQSVFRPVSQEEIHLKVAGIRNKFEALKHQLKQNVCNNVLSLQKQYHQTKKKKRGLSKKANQVLNQWFNDHIKDPYPNDEEKAKLAAQCTLTINQINNWFGNKRIRYKRKCWEEHRKKESDSLFPSLEQNKAKLSDIPSGSDSKSQPISMTQ